MNIEDIKQMVEGLSEPTKDVIIRKLRPEFARAVQNVNNLKPDPRTISPRPADIFTAFRLCPLDKIRVVLIGQDPYVSPTEAMGLAFSVPKGVKIPPSLKNIYACLHRCGLINEIPLHGDLTKWAEQGVLLINCAMTTAVRPNAHADCWTEYSAKVLDEISSLPQKIIFILLGGFAQQKAPKINKRHEIFKWGHPSPVNTVNKQPDNEKNFLFCDVFTKTNAALIKQGQPPINWDPNVIIGAAVVMPVVLDADVQLQPKLQPNLQPTEPKFANELRPLDVDDPTPLTSDTLWIFTDGGTKANGKANCEASWAYYMTDGCYCAADRGRVDLVDIPGKVYKTSNQRAELTAIFNALKRLEQIEDFSYNDIRIISDSEYSVNCFLIWVDTWQHAGTVEDHLNIDIIVPAKEIIEQFESFVLVKLQHVNASHDYPEPEDKESEEWFIWSGNNIVDKHCDAVLGVVGKKGKKKKAKK